MAVMSVVVIVSNVWPSVSFIYFLRPSKYTEMNNRHNVQDRFANLSVLYSERSLFLCLNSLFSFSPHYSLSYSCALPIYKRGKKKKINKTASFIGVFSVQIKHIFENLAKRIKEKIRLLELEILRHPQYSPDLTPTDLHLFRSQETF